MVQARARDAPKVPKVTDSGAFAVALAAGRAVNRAAVPDQYFTAVRL